MPDVDTGTTKTVVNTLDADLFRRVPGESRLIASRCTRCSDIAFPAQPSCQRCGAEQTEHHLLGPRGLLWTWTVQTFPLKPPYQASDPFEPFGVGYIEFPGEVRVQARLTESDPDALYIGMPMELVIAELRDTPGTAVYAFAPVEKR